MLCNRCQSILQSQADISTPLLTDHHADSKSFKAAIMGCCFLCTALASEIDNVEQKLENSTITSHTKWRSSGNTTTYRIRLWWIARSHSEAFNHGREILLVPSQNPGLELLLQKKARNFLRNLRPLSRHEDLAPRPSLDVARTWMNECLERHPKCKIINSWRTCSGQYQPKRLIDVGHGKGQTWKLVISEDAVEYRYATLSHRWTLNQQPCLSQSNLDDFKNGQPVSGLPQAFQDAIKVAISLGIRYIWIDCLCIIQDSDSDWQTESLKMCKIYSHSVLNISATGVSSNAFGFLEMLNKPLLLPPQIKKTLAPRLKNTWQAVDPFFWWAEVTKTPLMKRGWVFQERFLAPRVLHFGAQQMLWECAELDACEIYPKGLTRLTKNVGHTGFKNLDPFLASIKGGSTGSSVGGLVPVTGHISFDDELLRSWCNTVESYTRTSLTKGKDKLIALAGVAEMMSSLYAKLGGSSSGYAAGIFTHHVLPMLEWHAHSPLKTKFKTSGSRPDDKDYRAPSWSWASIDGRVYYEFLPGVFGHWDAAEKWRSTTWKKHGREVDKPRKNIGWKPLVFDLVPNVIPVAGSGFGQVERGSSLRCRGRIVPLATIKTPTLSTLLYEDPSLDPVQDSSSTWALPLRCIDFISSEGERSWWITGLMIQPVDDLRRKYRRCGLFFIPSSLGIRMLDIDINADREVKYSNGTILDQLEII